MSPKHLKSPIARGKWLLGGLAGVVILTGVAYLFGTVIRVPLREKIVALTYDDGPNPPYTNEIVEYLHAQSVPATFFVVGRAVARWPDVVRQELQSGDVIGNHTWDHTHLVEKSNAQIAAELAQTDAMIQQKTGVRTRLFRPPYGSLDVRVIAVVRHLGYDIIMWSIPLSKDWENPPPSVIRDRVIPYVKDGDIITLHDGDEGHLGNRSSSVAATKLIVERLKEMQFRFVTIPELLALRPNAHPTPFERE